MVGVRARLHAQVQRELGGVRERPEELLGQLMLESPGRAWRQLGLEQREGTSGDVDRDAGACLVHRHGRPAVADDPDAVSERGVERLTEHDRRVLGGVVRARLQIAGDHNVEVRAPVAREQVEHVVQEADPRAALTGPGAFEGQRQAHVGLAGPAFDGRRAAHCP